MFFNYSGLWRQEVFVVGFRFVALANATEEYPAIYPFKSLMPGEKLQKDIWMSKFKTRRSTSSKAKAQN